jgi:Ca2+-binding EF-hand superfamily protein
MNKLSPFDAFRAADLNKNGVITVDELRMQVKKMLGQDSFNAKDLKLLMISLDYNKNGTIEEDEYLDAFQRAREAK